MNKISRAFYTLVLLPRRLYESWGINTGQLALILRYKLIMDDRRPNTFQQTRGRVKKEGISNAMLGTMLMALVMGMINLIAFVLGKDDITHFSFFFLAFLFLLASVLITDFTSVLIDVKDNMILLPKPVNDRTILMAKLLHILVHLIRVILPMSLPAIIYNGMATGWWAALSLFSLVLLASLFAIFLINAVYLLVLKIMSAEKFKSFIAWFQVGFVIFIYGGYQVFLRLTDRSEFQQFSIAENPFVRIFPPYWFGRAWTTLNGSANTGGWFFLVLSVITSLGSIWVVISILAPAFNQKLSMINSSGAEPQALSTVNYYKQSTKRKPLPELLVGLLTRDAITRAGFLFTWRWTNRNRGFRMRVYPTIGYLVIWVILMFLPRTGDQAEGSAKMMGDSFGFIFLLYMSSFIIISAIQQIAIADEYKASWVFYSYPVGKPGSIIQGSFLSMVCKFFLPLAFLLFVGGIVWKGWEILPNLLLGLSNQLVICCTILLLGRKSLPASRPPVMKDKSGNFLRGMMMMIITGSTGLMHFLVYKFIAVVLLLTVLSILANWLLIKKIGEISWAEIKDMP
ncbi:hypothetical protein [Flavihumibacter profundi]|uniref:hypothetical protein n=1 Tax=Flavihumibacter profundi TaxID=2716883 RepID=UPI001CC73BB4|nr:hypothetical protein [Flavihumibacter profundi]MBZ5858732.1 hypothetical protein [Flavihumibacter profundi]